MTTPEPRAEVVVVYKSLPHYRVAFYEELRTRLASDGVRFRLLVGQPDTEMAKRRDTATIDWAETFQNRYISMGRRSVVWQPVLRSLRSADLVIVEQASKLLINYLLIAWRRMGGPLMGYWGHGQNLDVDAASPLAEAIKRRLADQADWWFCYTNGTARLVESFGVRPERMTVVQNATDTRALRRAREAITTDDRISVRAELGLGNGPVGLSVGSIYPTKRPEFLLQAADVIRGRLPEFELIVVGDGPDRALLDSAALTRPWLHVMGTRMGEDLARVASVASVVLNPGLVGLSVVDGFALGLPMVTCDAPFHSPEVEYLSDAQNGLILPADTRPEGYAAAIADLLTDERRLSRLQLGAIDAAATYTIEQMVDRFARGVLTALGREPHQQQDAQPRRDG